MKRLLAIILLSGIAYGGWLFYQQSQIPLNSSTAPAISSVSTFSLQNKADTMSNLESVLGESISAGIGTITELANTVTGGSAEPVINKAISNFQAELKQLPEDQVKKIQYNYCRGIVEEYERTE